MINETKKRGRRLMIYGLILASLSAWLVYQRLAAQPVQAEPQRVAVAYLRFSLGPRTSIEHALTLQTDSNVTVCPHDKLKSLVIGAIDICLTEIEFVPKDALKFDEFTTPEQLSEPGTPDKIRAQLQAEFQNKFNASELGAGTILLRSLLNSYSIPNGMRAVDISNIDTEVQPGDWVDVIVSYEKSPEQLVTQLLIPNVEVIATSDVQTPEQQFNSSGIQGTNDNHGLGFNRTVRVLVSITDTLQLLHMQTIARKIHLAIRGGGEQELTQETLSTVTLENFNR